MNKKTSGNAIIKAKKVRLIGLTSSVRYGFMLKTFAKILYYTRGSRWKGVNLDSFDDTCKLIIYLMLCLKRLRMI